MHSVMYDREEGRAPAMVEWVEAQSGSASSKHCPSPESQGTPTCIVLQGFGARVQNSGLTDHDRFTEEGAQRFLRAVCSAFGKRVLNREQTRSRDALRLDGVWSSGARGCAVEDALTKS